MFPELGRTVGYAVTVIYELADSRFQRLSFKDVLIAVENSPKPCILVMKQNIPNKIKKKNGLSGGNMTTALKTLGCVGCISDGPSRDMDEIRPMKFQYMLTGVAPGHGDFSVAAVNVPVSVGSMDVAPGEIIHMDENGAVKFPSDKLEKIVELAERLQRHETNIQANIRACTTAEDIIHALSDTQYGDE
jgi:regulator of RNase E activity RraA